MKCNEIAPGGFGWGGAGDREVKGCGKLFERRHLALHQRTKCDKLVLPCVIPGYMLPSNSPFLTPACLLSIGLSCFFGAFVFFFFFFYFFFFLVFFLLFL
jgi:hypothetical protein